MNGRGDAGQRIELLFPRDGRTVEVQLDDDGATDAADALTGALLSALETDDPDDAERRLVSGMKNHGRVHRRP